MGLFQDGPAAMVITSLTIASILLNNNDAIAEAISPISFREIDQAGRIRRAQKKAFTARLVFALLGRISLIGPILIMTLHESTSTSLSTVSVATFIFALVMALFATKVDRNDVLAATATYAALLVVFIGTSKPSNANWGDESVYILWDGNTAIEKVDT